MITNLAFSLAARQHTSYKWINAVESGQVSAAVFLDFQKAFDKVWHKGLLFKLATCGVTAEALERFQS